MVEVRGNKYWLCVRQILEGNPKVKWFSPHSNEFLVTGNMVVEAAFVLRGFVKGDVKQDDLPWQYSVALLRLKRFHGLLRSCFLALSYNITFRFCAYTVLCHLPYSCIQWRSSFLWMILLCVCVCVFCTLCIYSNHFKKNLKHTDYIYHTWDSEYFQEKQFDDLLFIYISKALKLQRPSVQGIKINKQRWTRISITRDINGKKAFLNVQLFKKRRKGWHQWLSSCI